MLTLAEPSVLQSLVSSRSLQCTQHTWKNSRRSLQTWVCLPCTLSMSDTAQAVPTACGEQGYLVHCAQFVAPHHCLVELLLLSSSVSAFTHVGHMWFVSIMAIATSSACMSGPTPAAAQASARAALLRCSLAP